MTPRIIISISASGDVIVRCHLPDDTIDAISFSCSSEVLQRSSPFLRTMFDPSFPFMKYVEETEGSRRVITLDGGSRVANAVLGILHDGYTDVPVRQEGIVLDLAVFCDQYDLVANMQPHMHKWVRFDSKDCSRKHLGELLAVGWVFGNRELFESASRRIIMEATWQARKEIDPEDPLKYWAPYVVGDDGKLEPIQIHEVVPDRIVDAMYQRAKYCDSKIGSVILPLAKEHALVRHDGYRDPDFRSTGDPAMLSNDQEHAMILLDSMILEMELRLEIYWIRRHYPSYYDRSMEEYFSALATKVPCRNKIKECTEVIIGCSIDTFQRALEGYDTKTKEIEGRQAGSRDCTCGSLFRRVKRVIKKVDGLDIREFKALHDTKPWMS